jgi:hypothetical protein
VDGNSSEQRPQAFDQRRARGGAARRRRMGTTRTRTRTRRRERADDFSIEGKEERWRKVVVAVSGIWSIT